MQITLNPNLIADYQRFLQIKSLPVYSFNGRVAAFPDEYADRLNLAPAQQTSLEYAPHPWSFDYQAAVTRTAICKQKFAIFADCGLGKTLMLLDYAAHVSRLLPPGQCVLIVSPLMVVQQTLDEAARFYGSDLPIEQVPSSGLAAWLKSGTARVGITNYEALNKDVPPGRIGCLILDESSMLKSHYGKWGRACINLGRGLHWKLALTGTPAPNDRIEYANHAVFLDQFPTVNAFLARYFVNRGQTDNRWELKPHALRPFYRSLSHWCIFLTDPAVYGWRDNTESVPPIHVNIHHVDLTAEQEALVRGDTGTLFANKIGGITSRTSLSTLAKGFYKGNAVQTNKTPFICDLVDSWPGESTIIWCLYNSEQEQIAAAMPDAASITGSTPHEERLRLIEDFKSGRRNKLISKPKILGFGLNLQIATRQVFSGLQDSYESYYQAVKRSNRYGSTKPLNVHIPVTDLEMPMVETVLRKANRVQQDTCEQERLFRESFDIPLASKPI